MKIKCLVSDIDGTLLRNKFKFFSVFSPRTLKEIREFCSDEKRKLVLASGRDLKSTRKIAEKIEKKVKKKIIPYLICLNGATIFDNLKKEEIFKRIFEINNFRNILNFLISRKISFFLLTSNKKVVLVKSFFSMIVYFFYFFGRYRPIFFKKKNILFAKDLEIQKISLVSFLPINKRLRREILENFGSDFYCSSISNFYLEIIDKKINKFYAWKEIAKKMGISSNEWCAIGNEENDILLLENSPFGVFVDPDKVKHLKIDPIKFSFHTSNKRGVAVGNSIKELRKNKYY